MHIYRNAFRVVAVTVLPLTMLAISDQPAHAAPAGPPQVTPTVTCDTITIDPDPGWGVVFTGHIGTHAGLNLPATPVPGTHNSVADISDLTTATGDIPWTITPVWTIPENPYGVTSGDGPTTSGVLHCHDEPTTTTSTTVKATTTTSTSTSVTPTTSVSTSVPPPTATPTTMLGIAARRAIDTLPFTGSTPWLAGFGLSCLAGGSLFLLKGRSKGREVRRNRKLLDR